MRDKTGLLFTSLVGTNIANYMAPFCLTIVFAHTLNIAQQAERERMAELYTTLILTPTVFIFGEIVPKNIFHLNADALMRRVARFIQWTYYACRVTGLLFIQRTITRAVVGILRRDQGALGAMPARAEVYHMLRESAAEGTLTVAQSSMVERIHRLNTIRLRDVMVPQKAVVMAEHDQTRADLEPRLARTRYSRMPVYKSSRKSVIGIVHILDILNAEPNTEMKSLARTTCRINGDANVFEALGILQTEYGRMAIVVNDAGDCIGIATIKDLVEEIVGELAAF
jgi:CBS domain containing-hemolysin-like protein